MRAKFAKLQSFLFRALFKKSLANSNNGRDLLDSLSGHVEFLDIIKIERSNFSGHVYNLQTKSEWYLANNIITHNCRHRLAPYIEELDDDFEKNLAYSNRKFALDSKEKQQVDAYHAAQKKRAEANSIKREWQQAKLLAPDETPKILSRFKDMKKEDNEQYKNIKQKERIVKKEQIALS